MADRTLGQKAKEALTEFVPVIDEKISEYFDREITQNFGFNQRQQTVVREALEHAKELILRPQKHLRGSFVVYGALLGQRSADERIWKAAVAVEMTHGALLMHDDFMDQDILRRGGITTHKFYEGKLGNLHHGESMAVSVGDAVLCLGFELLESCGVPGATKQMLRAIANTAHGQEYDVTLEALHDWDEEDVIVLHKAKTAIYTYENPLLIGGHFAGIDGQVQKILHDYAMDGGVAFQLQDDILGVFGKPERTGKSVDSDLMQGKCTLLVLNALEKGTDAQRRKIKKVWGNWKAGKKELNAAREAIRESGSYEYNKQLAKRYAAKAAKTAEGLRKLDLNSRAIDYIQGIAEYMVEREV